jgi:hypothetical protein
LSGADLKRTKCVPQNRDNQPVFRAVCRSLAYQNSVQGKNFEAD